MKLLFVVVITFFKVCWDFIPLSHADGLIPSEYIGASMVAPGITIYQQVGDHSVETCTAGWIVSDEQQEVGFLTAAHCRHNDSQVWAVIDSHPTPIGFYHYVNPREDVAEVRILDSIPWTVNVVNEQTPTSSEVMPIEVRDTFRVCKLGTVSHHTCGIVKGHRGIFFISTAFSVHGDSGGPVWSFDHRLGRIRPVGITNTGITSCRVHQENGYCITLIHSLTSIHTYAHMNFLGIS